MKLRAVCYEDLGSSQRAIELASRLGVLCFNAVESCELRSKAKGRFLKERIGEGVPCLLFVFASDGLSLRTVGLKDDLSIRADFCSSEMNYRRLKGGGVGQMIARAVGVKSNLRPSVLDLTAGLGGDAFVLASLGCSVTLVERVPEIYELLSDAVIQAQHFGNTLDQALISILERMRFLHQEAKSVLDGLSSDNLPDVIYMDPMFPEKKKGALVRKEMQVFQQLVGEDLDTASILPDAITQAKMRVVVKRPKKAEPLSGFQPSHSLIGKTNRFDVYSKNGGFNE